MPTSIRLAPEFEQRLTDLAHRTGRSKAYYLREIVEKGLAEMEDYYLAADVLERVRKGEEKVHSARLSTPTRPKSSYANSTSRPHGVSWTSWTNALPHSTTRAAQERH